MPKIIYDLFAQRYSTYLLSTGSSILPPRIKYFVGLILGTGTNACYLENIDAIETIPDDEKTEGPKDMIINTEWGAFGENKELDFIKTKWDTAVDAGSLNPGRQTFEKMISGMYMGEITRQVLVDMVWEGLMFQ